MQRNLEGCTPHKRRFPVHLSQIPLHLKRCLGKRASKFWVLSPRGLTSSRRNGYDLPGLSDAADVCCGLHSLPTGGETCHRLGGSPKWFVLWASGRRNGLGFPLISLLLSKQGKPKKLLCLRRAWGGVTNKWNMASWMGDTWKRQNLKPEKK